MKVSQDATVILRPNDMTKLERDFAFLAAPPQGSRMTSWSVPRPHYELLCCAGDYGSAASNIEDIGSPGVSPLPAYYSAAEQSPITSSGTVQKGRPRKRKLSEVTGSDLPVTMRLAAGALGRAVILPSVFPAGFVRFSSTERLREVYSERFGNRFSEKVEGMELTLWRQIVGIRAFVGNFSQKPTQTRNVESYCFIVNQLAQNHLPPSFTFDPPPTFALAAASPDRTVLVHGVFGGVRSVCRFTRAGASEPANEADENELQAPSVADDEELFCYKSESRREGPQATGTEDGTLEEGASVKECTIVFAKHSFERNPV
ncbi:hypothetical protein WN51_12126 [Melipona quadrifasciata]|uniref:Uncharacterized protein n=1 Tax=Melipona quadrifasciata TaxID=166423 RepID=A0A0M9A3F0_9HYME|nr:hypothetical protein WN51_12126 [Melipona quadrifasciata]